MGAFSQTEVPAASPIAALPDESHFLQARAFLRRWRTRRKPIPAASAADDVPSEVAIPEVVWRHYRHFAWVIHEQRLLMLVLGFLMATDALVWTAAWQLGRRAPLVVRAAPSLKEAAASFYGSTPVSYDQLAFFLQGCLPLLYSIDERGHPLLPLAQGMVAPEVYHEAERRLTAADRDVRTNRMTQTLTITGVTDVVADNKSGRAAAYVRGYLTITVPQQGATFFPFRAQALLEANPVSQLNPYPFYLLRLDRKLGADAVAWDETHDNGSLLQP
jgi:hypothetical protein